ncbi:hypothetical protein LPJ70_001092 [Coemansia sp. RSA 2708]|nr:hypothetical protein LPJ70_001092 [Coemansia sp. RSA 2708]KAJ2298770.1 hypothetical protein IWW54_006585 [Coemansia sp. RSA 2705]KAJ2709687.1 hypothetical protein H4R23_006745 [Coemansia sp. Cherry 401B]
MSSLAQFPNNLAAAAVDSTMPQISHHLATSSRVSADALPYIAPTSESAQQPVEGFGTQFFKMLARARAAIIHEAPPSYVRGAWAIINDVPYPPPPPYACSRHPPSYDEAMEIGVVASPMRVEQQMQRRTSVPRVASAPQLSALADQASNLPETEQLPSYEDVEDTRLVSPVVQRWQLGEPAFEKPPMHPKGYTYDAERQ